MIYISLNHFSEIKKELFSDIARKNDISAEYFKEFMLKWVDIENELKHLYKAHNDKNFVAPSTLIKYIDDKELQYKLNNIRRIRNNMIHNADFNKQLPIENMESTLSELRDYLGNTI